MEIPFYFPENVQEFVAVGGNSFVGLVDNTTVFKYPRTVGEKSAIASLRVEARIYEAIGPHDRIIGFRGQKGEGLLLEYAPHGSLARYLTEHAATEQQRLKWSRQATEAVAVTHSRRVIHCDIKVSNLLLDTEFNVKLCDFQGRLLGSNGQILSDGGSSENPKFFMPRDDPTPADFITDIFALGSTIFHIFQGHAPFPELDSFSDEDEIATKFSSGQYPAPDCTSIREVLHNCWSAKYSSADEVLCDLQQICVSEDQ
ncbi:hypothetical protein ONS95_014975 [Cadophora gregata]|uniref:uncharacterized protein n=1 Tax=Cadophora gregata TaxID=51156 RepID=UPI0026DB4F01|nr:uncharacterized protein ONS95_014975 [Cadophora gregata]KAK0103178.1 hypothetical protein ONS96_005784 [Cadophora gregata f. sp. sojae]KAK0113281.1 hypothetical protein ONS95_014975 [Cadophora gregata]